MIYVHICILLDIVTNQKKSLKCFLWEVYFQGQNSPSLPLTLSRYVKEGGQRWYAAGYLTTGTRLLGPAGVLFKATLALILSSLTVRSN